MAVNAIKIISAGDSFKSREDKNAIGDVCITGSFMCGTETLCGHVDTTNVYEETNEPVNCPGCKEIYQSIKSSRNKIKFVGE